jgi:aarF domain-containing kinase
VTECEAAATVAIHRTNTVRVHMTDHEHDSILTTIRRILRLIRRILKLSITLSPIVALYPLQYLLAAFYPNALPDEYMDAHDLALATLAGSLELPSGPLGWYYKVCLYCVEWSGAAAIKMMQWAGSRPDMFGQAFCAVFSQLQDDTTPHSWHHTERLLREAYGEDWKKRIRLDKILGSGCIAQVYRGVICDEDGKEQAVAVKVMHPNVEEDIDADLDIMRLGVHVLERLPFQSAKDLQWINLPGFVEELAGMLKIQLDMRTEAAHLARFQTNFEGNDLILFPKLVERYKPTKEVLVETFCEGQPINDFIRTNMEQPKVLHDMCVGAIRAVCQMIFLDNFIHGDLHPGNVLVNKSNQFILLDAGIVVENSKRDHRLISDVLAAFIRRNGRRAGERMMEDSNYRMASSGERSVDEEQFLDRIEGLTEKAHGKDYFMQHLGKYITFICDSAARHHVMLNQAFISAALAVKVQEGIALALDPTVEVWKVAIPVILEGERKHGYAIDHAKEVIGLEDLISWVKGVFSSDKNTSSRS